MICLFHNELQIERFRLDIDTNTHFALLYYDLRLAYKT